jgi:hypothetical protein
MGIIDANKLGPLAALSLLQVKFDWLMGQPGQTQQATVNAPTTGLQGRADVG